MDRRGFFAFTLGLLASTRRVFASGHNGFCVLRDNGGAYIAEKRIIVQGSEYAAHQAQALASGQAQTVLVETDQGYQAAIQNIRNGGLPPGSAALFDRSRFPEIIIDGLDQKINSKALFFNIPETIREVRNVHGNKNVLLGSTDREISRYIPYFKDLAKKYRAMGAIKIAPYNSPSAADWLRDTLRRYQSTDLAIIASHVVKYYIPRTNPEGLISSYLSGKLPLIDGSTYMLDIADNIGPTVWTVGCETWDFVRGPIDFEQAILTTSSKINYRESFSIVKELMQGQTIREITNDIQKKDWKFKHTPSSAPALRGPALRGNDHPLPIPAPKGVILVAEAIEGKNILLTDKQVLT